MAEFLWALGDGSEGTLKQVFSAVQGRALLARGRIILPARLEPFVALTEFVPQGWAKSFLTEIGQGRGAVSETLAVPALSDPHL